MALYPLNQPVRVSVTIKDATGTLVNPGALTLTVEKPDATQQVYSSPVNDGTGLYHQDIPATDLTQTGAYTYVWVSTGTGAGAVPGDFDVYDPFAPVESTFYCTAEELKHRLGITDSMDDPEVELAVSGASRAIDEITGRYFYRATDTRTYVPESVTRQNLDDLVSVTTLKVDRDGDGVFEETWTQGTDYALEVTPGRYNVNAKGEPWPYTAAVVITGGKLFPYVWMWSHLDRVQVTGVFGWPAVPLNVKNAALIAAADLFRSKDAPFGVLGVGDLGVIRVGNNPKVQALLRRYINGNRVGV